MITARTQNEYIEQLKTMLGTNVVWAQHGLKVIFANQTFDEQRSESVNHWNCIGFTGSDAKFLTSLAKNLEKYGRLSEKQNAVLLHKMPKYARQIFNVCIERGSVVKIDGVYRNAPKRG